MRGTEVLVFEALGSGNVKLAFRLPNLSNVSPQGNNQINEQTVMRQRKGLSTHTVCQS